MMLPLVNVFCLYKTICFYSSFATRKKWALTAYALVFIIHMLVSTKPNRRIHALIYLLQQSLAECLPWAWWCVSDAGDTPSACPQGFWMEHNPF